MISSLTFLKAQEAGLTAAVQGWNVLMQEEQCFQGKFFAISLLVVLMSQCSTSQNLWSNGYSG